MTPPLLLTAQAGSPELDAEICVALRYLPSVEIPNLAEGWEWRWEAGDTFGDGPSVKLVAMRGKERGIGGITRKPPPVSQSLDAAVALVEERLPGWQIWLTIWSPTKSSVELIGPNLREYTSFEAPTAPLAILRALFAAKEADRG